jgi:hypothetical protein
MHDAKHESGITMVHESAGNALDSFQLVEADGFDEGRLLTVKIRPDRGPILFVSNVYNDVAAEGKPQQALFDHALQQVTCRVLNMMRTGLLLRSFSWYRSRISATTALNVSMCKSLMSSTHSLICMVVRLC